MNIKFLAVSIAAAACSTHVFAAEIYNSEGTTLALGGYVDVGVGEYGSDDDVEVHTYSPRLNISGMKTLDNGMTVDAKGEWGIDYLNGGESTFTTRLGYIGVTDEMLGRMVVGTQWSPYYDVGGVADMPIAFANGFLYVDHHFLGSARADKMVSYRNSMMLTDDVEVRLGLGWQGKNTDKGKADGKDSRMQAALSIEAMGVTLGAAFSDGKVNINATEQKSAESTIFSLNYGSYGEGIYLAGVYGTNEYFGSEKVAGDDNVFKKSYANYKETKQMEALAAYGMDNGLNLSVHYERVDNEDTSKKLYSNTSINAEYNVASGFVAVAGYKIDLGDDDPTTEDDNKWTVGMRYYF